MTGGGADTRVPIPNNVRKLIQEIKKTLGSKHSEEFVFATLRDSNMDPNEAGRRLKMIHDIIEIAGKHSVEDVYTMLKDCNMDPNEAAQRLLYIDTFHEVKKKQDRRKTISSDTSEDYYRTRGSQWRGAKGGRGTFYSSKGFDDVGGGRNSSSGKEYGVTNRQERVSNMIMPAHSGKENNVAHVPNSAASVNGTPALSNGSYSHKVAPQVSADVSSSTSESGAVSPQKTKHTCAVGTIKCEIVKRSESNGRLPGGVKFNADKVVAATIPVVAEVADSDNVKELKSDVEKNSVSESLLPISSLTENSSQVINPNQDNQPPQLLNEPLKVTVTAADDTTVAITNTHSVPEEESELKVSSPKLDVMLEKLTLASPQPVKFPDHLQIPDNVKIQFTFGSLDATPHDCKPLSVTESTQQIDEIITKPSLSNQNVATTAVQESEVEDDVLPHASEHVLPTQENVSHEPALNHEQTKVELMPPVGGFQHPVIQTTRDYNFGFMPHLMGPHFVHDVPDLQNGNSVVTSALGPTPVTQQAAAVSQSSVAMSPPVFPYFRQAYPNYIPYNPYLAHMYLPPNVHLLNHAGVFPQQPPAGNLQHMQAAAAAAAGVKFSFSSQHKQASNVGVGYAPANEDLNASQVKDNNLHSPAQQGEDPQVWAHAAGRDAPNLVPNYFYNFPHGQPMPFSPLHASLYQPLMYQPHTTPGTLEPPQQPPPTNWNTALLNRETT